MPIIMSENLIPPPENAFENLIHPLERANFAEIQSSYLISLLLNVLGRLHADLTSLAEVPDRALIVTSKNFPRLYDAYKIAHDKLELKKDYDLFCNFEYNRNAKTLGTDDNCIIVVDSSCVEDFSDEQLRALRRSISSITLSVFCRRLSQASGRLMLLRVCCWIIYSPRSSQPTAQVLLSSGIFCRSYKITS